MRQEAAALLQVDAEQEILMTWKFPEKVLTLVVPLLA